VYHELDWYFSLVFLANKRVATDVATVGLNWNLRKKVLAGFTHRSLLPNLVAICKAGTAGEIRWLNVL